MEEAPVTPRTPGAKRKRIDHVAVALGIAKREQIRVHRQHGKALAVVASLKKRMADADKEVETLEAVMAKRAMEQPALPISEEIITPHGRIERPDGDVVVAESAPAAPWEH